nr:MAG TPA: hypothetical protein [Caudoviricetes sp.]
MFTLKPNSMIHLSFQRGQSPFHAPFQGDDVKRSRAQSCLYSQLPRTFFDYHQRDLCSNWYHILGLLKFVI